MTKFFSLTYLCCILATFAFAQSDTTATKTNAEVFDRIMKRVKEYQPDTTDAPEDNMTGKIKELRNLKGGFNINEAIAFKLEEDKQKNEIPKEEIEKLTYFFKSGEGRRWLDNAVIWIYRKHFTYSELKELVKFYKTSAGQKMAIDFPILMLESLRAAEIIKASYTQQQKK